ncbi:MAG TPA: D-xylose transporter XylE [Cytophagales bacterium]|nr:D-xylose transporter XylE [Cytophagales bacterium]
MSTNKRYIMSITLVATLGGLLFGYDTAVISGAVGSLQHFFIDPAGLVEWKANFLWGLVTSSALLGCIVGGAVAGLVALKLGRKRGLLVAAVLFALSALGSALPELGFAPLGEGDHTFITHFIVYRFIGGVGVGLASMLSPMYIAEIAPAEQRGNMVSWNQFAIVFGMLVVYFVNWGIARQGNESWLDTIGWRWMFASELIPASIFFLLLFTVPESPRWLVIAGEEAKAQLLLTRLNGEKGKGILAEIKDSLSHVEVGRLFSFGKLVIIIGVLLSLFQQFVGINVVLYYAPEIFKSTGMGTEAALFQTILVGAINMIFTIIAIVSVDKYGRKPLMLIGALVMGVSMLVLGGTFAANQMGVASLIFMMIYTAAFALSWGPVTWVLLSEIFPNRIRGKAMALAVAVQWACNFIVSQTFPMMNNSTWLNDQFNHGFAYWIYGLCSLLAAWFVWKIVPETKGKTLEEMENLWTSEEGSSQDKTEEKAVMA